MEIIQHRELRRENNMETHKNWKEREAGELANMIINQMRDKRLTLEVLNDSVKLVQDVFTKNAMLLKSPLSKKDD
jgi:hypothetical protein